MQLSPEILTQTLALPRAERAALAHELLLSLGPPGVEEEDDLESVLEARLDAVESGNFSARDCSEAMADMRKALEKRRQS
jgi:hypothetical protein